MCVREEGVPVEVSIGGAVCRKSRLKEEPSKEAAVRKRSHVDEALSTREPSQKLIVLSKNSTVEELYQWSHLEEECRGITI